MGSKGAINYFDKIPDKWDRLYSNRSWLWRKINYYLRRGLYDRYHFTFEYCGKISGARVLDIGCGTGQYCIEFARRGAASVVGIDFAPSMIKYAQEKARENKLTENIKFICDDFLSYNFKEQFDIVVALGFFDYIKNPDLYFNKISYLTKRRFLASFIKDSIIWGTQKKIRYILFKKCQIYFYTYDILRMLYENNFNEYQIISSKKGFFGIGINKK